MQPSNCDVDDEVLSSFADALSLKPSNTYEDDDDKYAKFAAKGRSHSKACDSIQQNSKAGVLSFETVPWHLLIFTCFVLSSGFAYSSIGVAFNTNLTERFASLQLEILGLVLLREKIKSRKSVSGISGMTFLMYTAVYVCRIAIALPPWWLPGVFGNMFDSEQKLKFDKEFSLKDLDLDVTLGICSLILVLDILKSIFLTRRNTYEAELDVLKAWYLMPVCWSISLLVRPQFEPWSFEYAYCWSSTLYMDVLALMPQVVMMAKSGGKVETPIANFVAVTTIARCGDLMNSMVFLYETSISNPFSTRDLTSFLMAVAVQFVHIALVADFIYYFCKARAARTTDRTPFCCCGCCDQSDIVDLNEVTDVEI